MLLTAALASVTEPLDFLFCFLSPVLWLAHGAVAGTFMVLLDVCGVTGFTSGLLSSLAMNLSAGVERTHYPVLYLLAAAEIAVYFMVFTFLIRRFDLRTPGREEEAPTQAPAGREEGFPFKALVAALGGRENILRSGQLPDPSAGVGSRTLAGWTKRPCIPSRRTAWAATARRCSWCSALTPGSCAASWMTCWKRMPFPLKNDSAPSVIARLRKPL